MLCLSRYEGEWIVLQPSGIRIGVNWVRDTGQVGLMIEAPQTETILREELLAKTDNGRTFRRSKGVLRNAKDGQSKD